MHVSTVRARGQFTSNVVRDVVSSRIFAPILVATKGNKFDSIFTKLHFDIHAKTTGRSALFFIMAEAGHITGCGVGCGFGFVLVGGNLKNLILDCGETAVSGSLDLSLSNSFANATIGPRLRMSIAIVFVGVLDVGRVSVDAVGGEDICSSTSSLVDDSAEEVESRKSSAKNVLKFCAPPPAVEVALVNATRIRSITVTKSVGGVVTRYIVRGLKIKKSGGNQWF